MLKKLDQKLFLKIYAFTAADKRLRRTAVFITKLSSLFFSMIYFSAGGWLFYNKSCLDFYLIIPASVYLSVKIIPYIYNRKRPFVVFNKKNLVKQRSDHSFPSTHAASSMIISLVIFNINLQLGILMILMAVITGFSRIMVGVHYPSDVIVSWLTAGFIYFLGINILL